MGNSISSYSQKSLFLLPLFFPLRNNNQETQNDDGQESQRDDEEIITIGQQILPPLPSAPSYGINHGVRQTTQYVPIRHVPIPNHILLPEVGRGGISIPDNTGITQYLISRATSANQIIFIDSGEGYISDVVLNPPGQQLLGPCRIEIITGTILPANLNRDRLDQNRVMQNVAGNIVLVPDVSEVIVRVSNLQGEGHLITYGLVWVFVIFYRVDDLGGPGR